MKNYLACLLIIFQSSTAFCDKDVIYLPKDNPSPFNGYLFSIPKEKEVRLTNEKYKYEHDLNLSLTQYNKHLEEQGDLLEKRINNKDQQINNLTDQLSDSNGGFFSKAGYFILGAALTFGISYGVYKSK